MSISVIISIPKKLGNVQKKTAIIVNFRITIEVIVTNYWAAFMSLPH